MHNVIHYSCACACVFHLRSHVGRDAPDTERNANHARGAPWEAARCDTPQCHMRAAAHRGSWVKFFSLARLSIFTCKTSPTCSINVAHLFVAFCCPFHPHTHINEGNGARGQLPLSHGGVEGGPPPRGTFFSVLVNVHNVMQIGLNCSETLLPTNPVWNFVAFAHLPYL